MADRHRASPRSVRLGYEDHEWLARLAQDEGVSIDALAKRAVRHFRHWHEEGEEALKEALKVFEAERSGREDERRRRLYFQRKYESQSRRLHDMLRDERPLRSEREKQLRDERKLRTAYEHQLRGERKLRTAYEHQLRDERKLRTERENQLRDELQAKAAGYSPTVAKLLTLAIRSESDGEAMTAVAKARALHRKERSSMADAP